MAPKTDWNPLLSGEFNKPYWSELMGYVAEQRSKHPVYPPEDQVFSSLHLTSYAEVKVLILGQDPYHGRGQAHGLCFSVPRGISPPPSLLNIHQELASDLGCPPPDHGSLESWARQGVLLLNTTLTVRSGAAASHQKRGWETFTDEVIRVVNEKQHRVVFILWGSSARSKKQFVNQARHTVVESAHPSPLSAHRGFFGSKPFSKTNEALSDAGLDPISWCIPPADE